MILKIFFFKKQQFPQSSESIQKNSCVGVCDKIYLRKA